MPEYDDLHRRELLARWCAAAGSVPAMVTTARGQAPRLADSEIDETEGPAVDCDFPGGNVVFQRIEGERVYLHQDQRDTPGFWFYW